MSRLPELVWQKYADDLARIDGVAAKAVKRYIVRNGVGDPRKIVDIAYAVATKYGEASAALAAEMYDTVALMEDVILAPAVPAATATYEEAEAAIFDALGISQNENFIASAAARLVKLAGADTTLQNAKRDNAEWAWIPIGDTCAFCITLASQGWQPASKAVMNGNHATHIHANCDCAFSVRHTKDGGVNGYDPDKYRRMYYDAPLDGEAPSSKNRINAMRREFYAENKDEINAQKRDAYAKRVELNSSKAEEKDV